LYNESIGEELVPSSESLEDGEDVVRGVVTALDKGEALALEKGVTLALKGETLPALDE
jgi:hypothetical protein